MNTEDIEDYILGRLIHILEWDLLQAMKWYQRPHILFNGLSAQEMVMTGQSDLVLKVLNQLEYDWDWNEAVS